MKNPHEIFTKSWALETFPAERTDSFFEALFGEAEEGAYDIVLAFIGTNGGSYEFAFELHQRPNKCLVCNLTYGLPQVFARHPVINIRGVVEKIAACLGKNLSQTKWELKTTQEINKTQHNIPLLVSFTD